MQRMTKQVAWWFPILLLGCGRVLAAPLPDEPSHAAHYSGLGQLYSHALLTGAYAKVWDKYVVDPDSHGCEPAAVMQATPLQGQLERIAANRLFMLTLDGQRVALAGYRGSASDSNTAINCMVIRAGSRTISARDKNREVMAIAQYRDVTMSFMDFVGFLRLGFHFPEAPELMTQAGRRRLSATDRTNGSKVDEYLKLSPDQVTAPATSAVPTGY